MKWWKCPTVLTEVDVKETVSKLSISSIKQNYKNSHMIWPKITWKYQEMMTLQIFLFFSIKC